MVVIGSQALAAPLLQRFQQSFDIPLSSASLRRETSLWRSLRRLRQSAWELAKSGRLFWIVSRPFRRFWRRPEVRQDTLRYALSAMMSWTVFYWTRNPYALLYLLAADFGLSAIRRATTPPNEGFGTTSQERNSLYLAGLIPMAVGAGILFFGHLPVSVMAIFSALNGWFMGYASLVRQRSGLRRPLKKKAVKEDNRLESTERSSGARWLGTLAAAVGFLHWAGSLGAGRFRIQLVWDVLHSTGEIGLLFIFIGALFWDAGTRLDRALRLRDRAATPPTRPSLESLFHDKDQLRTLFLLFVNTALVPVLAWPVIAQPLLQLSFEEIPVVVVCLAISFWAGSRLNERLQERFPLGLHQRLSWRVSFLGSGALLALLGGNTLPFWPLMLAALALGFFVKTGYVTSKYASSMTDSSEEREGQARYSTAVHAGIACGALLFAWLMAGVGPAHAVLAMGGALILFEGLLMLPHENLKLYVIRKFMMRNPGWTLSALTAALSAYRDHSWLLANAAFWSARLATIALTLAFVVVAPMIGHDYSHRLAQTVNYAAPGSTSPDPWTPTGTLDGIAVREGDTLVLSDAHLRDPYMRARLLKDLLQHHAFRRLILLGDFLDYQVKGRTPPEHKEIIWMIARRQQERQVEVIYCPGNHDERLDRYAGTRAITARYDGQTARATITVARDYTWTLPDGRTAYALHGHRQDPVAKNPYNPLLHLGTWAYDELTRLDVWMQKQRQRDKWYSTFYFAPWGKKIVKRYLRHFDERIAREAYAHGATVAIYGHTHAGGIREVEIDISELTQRNPWKKAYVFLVLWCRRMPLPARLIQELDAFAAAQPKPQLVTMLVVNADNSQNTTHVGAVLVRQNIELIQWSHVLADLLPAPDNYIRTPSGQRLRQIGKAVWEFLPSFLPSFGPSAPNNEAARDPAHLERAA